MAVSWSSETAKWELRELQATSMAVDATGTLALLAGKKCLALKRLCEADGDEDDAEDAPKKTTRQSKYDVAGAEWCHTVGGEDLCAISSNRRVDVFRRTESDLVGLHSLRAHTRAVSDTHWHREERDLLATCSVDTFTYLWDLRDPRKPAQSLSAVAGASQVQWNKVASHSLATAHDGDVKLWDRRKTSASIRYISAHLCKIHGLDWSPHHEYRLATSSHDGTIKFFDVNDPRRVENTITTNYPVWRAVFTPFGSGLVTMGVGWGGVTRGDQAGVVGMWANGALVHRFVGHADVVLQMQWKPNSSPSDYRLVTWARDQTLRVWSVHPSLLKMCSHYLPDDDDDEDDTSSESMSYVSTSEILESHSIDDIKMVKLKCRDSNNLLSEEFDAIKNIENVTVQDIDLDQRTCAVRLELNSHVAILRIIFSSSYPFDQVIPKFLWLSGTNLDIPSTIKILQAINFAAYQKIRQQSICVVFCLKTLCNYLLQIPVKLTDEGSSSRLNEISANQENSENAINSAGDHCIPFPRTCGARWCGVGILVVFNRPPNAKRMSLKQESTTPRSLSSLSTPMLIGGTYRSHSPHLTTSPSPTNVSSYLHHRPPSHSITTFYFQDRWKASSRRNVLGVNVGLRNSISSQFSPKITLYSVDKLFYLNKKLAEKYVIDSKYVSDMCEYNAKIAESIGRLDLMQAWQLSALTAKNLDQRRKELGYMNIYEDESIDWSLHPFRLNMMQALISYYAKTADIQMAAMLSCAFSKYYTNQLIVSESSSISSESDESESSPCNTINNISEISTDGWSLPISKAETITEMSESNITHDMLQGKGSNSVSSPVLDTSTIYLYQSYMKMYADILHRWNLLEARTEVMKHLLIPPLKHNGIDLLAECNLCKKVVKNEICPRCGNYACYCYICNLPVRGVSNACLICGHGGHTKHLEEWFSKYDMCPSGCGCRCLQETGNIMERYSM